MCLGVPMMIETIDGTTARCSARGITREVNLLLLQDQTVAPGDCVIVHVGYAIQKVSVAQARTSWALYERMLAGSEGADA